MNSVGCLVQVILVFGLATGCALAGEDGAGPSGPRGEAGGGGKSDDPAGDEGMGGARLVPAVDVSHWTKTLTDPDVDCFWGHGYRHVIVGTQRQDVTRPQLDISLRGGMTVDLYIYLYWDIATDQVQNALEIVDDYPEIGTVWLDLEEDPAGRSTSELIDIVDESIALLGNVPYGIYTSKGFWQTYMDDTEHFADEPLWYARYDNNPSLDTYFPDSHHAFGGWGSAVGKQWDDHSPGTCGRAVDKNTIWIDSVPSVVVDRSEPADDGQPPAAPTGLWPDDGVRITTDYVRPTAIPLREATGYQLDIELWNLGKFSTYWQPRRPVSDLTFYPYKTNRTYRWRIRATDASGTGAWSEWAHFEFGTDPSPPPAGLIDD